MPVGTRVLGRKKIMEPYKVILIDDEPIITEGLQILIEWEDYNCEIIATACDGEEGLSLITSLKPDIVICDIRMPNCSGIEMITRSLALCPCRFIVLSGHSDFSYAKQCMSLGVTEYLLKPVVEQELIQALTKVQQLIQKDQETENVLTQLEDASQQLSALALDDILRDIMNSYFDTNNDFMNALMNYDISFPSDHIYTAAAISFASSQKQTHIRQLLSEKLCGISDHFLLYYQGNNTYMGVFSLPAKSAGQNFHESVCTLHQSLVRELSEEINIGIGKAYTEMYHLPFSCKQAVFALSYKMIRGTNSVNPFENTLENAHFILSIPDELFNAYRISLLQSKFASISGAIHKIFTYMTDISAMSLLGIQINSLNLVMTCIQHLTDNETAFPSVSFENMDCLSQISSIQSAKEMEKYVENLVYNLINICRETQISKPGELVSQVENYINSHYLEDLSLMIIAQMFYVSPIYLSQIFKKQTGTLFIDYVTQVKINAAKNLLMTTDLKVYEIAERLHYKDHKYFSKLFEKKTGKKPSEFRKGYVRF